MSHALPALLLAACGNPLVNDPPQLVAVNGQEADSDGNFILDVTDAGEVVDLTLDVHDPEGRDVSVWWPYAPPGLSFDPHGTTGTWDRSSDLDLEVHVLMLVLEDAGHDPALSQWQISVRGVPAVLDTGYYTY